MASASHNQIWSFVAYTLADERHILTRHILPPTKWWFQEVVLDKLHIYFFLLCDLHNPVTFHWWKTIDTILQVTFWLPSRPVATHKRKVEHQYSTTNLSLSHHRWQIAQMLSHHDWDEAHFVVNHFMVSPFLMPSNGTQASNTERTAHWRGKIHLQQTSSQNWSADVCQ